MRVSCPSCQTNYNIDDKRIPPGGAKLKCTRCQTTFPIKLGIAAAEKPAEPTAVTSVPLPGAKGSSSSGAGAIPLPGSGLPRAPTFADAGAIPLPGSGLPRAPVGAVPLPGLTAPRYASPPPESEATEIVRPGKGAPAAGAIPLPGLGAAAPTTPVPLPGIPSAAEAGAVPLPGLGDLPGFSSEPTPAVPLPGIGMGVAAPPADPFSSFDANWESESTRVATIPLPSAAFREPPAEAVPTAVHNIRPPRAAYPTSDSIPLPGTQAPSVRMTDPAMPAVPLPGDDEVGFADADLVSDGSVPLPGRRKAAPPPPEIAIDFSSPVTSENTLPARNSFDISDLPAPASDKTQGAGFDLSDLPSPSGQSGPPPSEMDFSELPSPAGAPAPASFDFQDLPSPSIPDLPSPAAPPPADFGLDFAAPPAPTESAVAAAPAPRAAPAPASFGEVDFGSPPPSAAADLEFDPLAQAPSPPKDELEADLSAPPPSSGRSSAGPADGLEMLSFIDDAAKANKSTSKPKAKAVRFHIRRKSGKVFGPFEQGVVVKMLEDGQLLGNEDISTDNESWSGIGTVAAFQEVIERLMESPSASRTGVSSGGASATQVGSAPSAPTQSQQSMDRLKQLYEGRMAAVAVVDHRVESARFKKRLPLLAGVAVAVLLIGAGASLSLTPYGAFGLKKLLPAQVKPGTAEFADLQKGRAALLSDTFKSYSDALKIADHLLQAKEYPEVRALWCQAVYYLERRYAAAKPDQVATAQRSLEGIQLLGDKNAEAVKASAGDALARKAPDEVLPRLEAAAARAPDDVELSLVLAEVYAAKRQNKQAADTLTRVLAKHKDSAKALHALGDIRQQDKNADEAAKLYEQALAADHDHVKSAIELAAVELLVRNDLPKGKDALQRALDPKMQALMGPAEVSRARALDGLVLSREFKPKEAVAELEEALKLDKDSVFAKAVLGRVYLGEGNFTDAVPLFQEATAKDPLNLEYTDGYLSALIGAGKMADAKSVVAQANTRFPGNARIAYLFGRVEDALDNTADAETQYKRAIAADPKLYEADLYLARMYLRGNRVKDAQPEMEAAEKKAPQVAAVHAGAGELALAQNDVDHADGEFKQSIDLDPAFAEAYLGRAQVDLARGQAADAKSHAQKALELEPKVRNGRLQLGLALWKLGDLDGALAELEKAKQESFKSAAILLTIGAVRLDRADKGERGQLALAEESVSSALSLEPTNPDGHYYMARVKNRKQEHTQAIESMRNALERAPNNALYHYTMGLVLHDAKKTPDAIDEWNATLKLDPGYADALEALGHAHLDRGEFDQAIGYFEKCLKIDVKRTRVLSAIGDCYFQAGKWDKAIENYQKTLKADASYAPAYYQVGRAFTEKGQSDKAIEWYRRATQADPTNAQAFYYLGFAYKDRGLRGEAVKAFRAYLAKRPEAEDKKEIEDEIYDLSQD